MCFPFLNCTQVTLKFHSCCSSLSDGCLMLGFETKCCFDLSMRLKRHPTILWLAMCLLRLEIILLINVFNT